MIKLELGIDNYLTENERYAYKNELMGDRNGESYESILQGLENKTEFYSENEISVNGNMILDIIKNNSDEKEFNKFKSSNEHEIKEFIETKTNLKEVFNNITSDLKYDQFINKVSGYIYENNIRDDLFEKSTLIFSKIEENLDKKDFDKFLNSSTSEEVKQFLESKTNIKESFNGYPSQLKYSEFLEKISNNIQDKIGDINLHNKTMGIKELDKNKVDEKIENKLMTNRNIERGFEW